MLTVAPLTHAAVWLNGRPDLATLDGRVVVVDVFTFDCVNCKHVVPELRKLRTEYPKAQLQIVGAHSPETAYDRDPEALAANLALQGITWPVAVDDDCTLWHAFGADDCARRLSARGKTIASRRLFAR